MTNHEVDTGSAAAQALSPNATDFERHRWFMHYMLDNASTLLGVLCSSGEEEFLRRLPEWGISDKLMHESALHFLKLMSACFILETLTKEQFYDLVLMEQDALEELERTGAYRGVTLRGLAAMSPAERIRWADYTRKDAALFCPAHLTTIRIATELAGEKVDTYQDGFHDNWIQELQTEAKLVFGPEHVHV